MTQDPTRSQTLRREYARRLRGRWRTIRAEIRKGVEENDIFGLRQNQPPNIYRFPTDDEKIDRFFEWLEMRQQEEILDVISVNDNPYIRNAYNKGARHADIEMRKVGLLPPTDVDIFNLPQHQEAVSMLYTRNFRELEGITEATNQQISRVLTDGFSQGHGPIRIARDMNDRIDKIGMTRSETMARTEIINAHSEAMLNRYEEMEVDELTVKAEWLTAQDNDVCPICASLEGRTQERPMTTQEVREGTFQFEGSEYPRKPPLHPNCRCTLVPVTR